MFQTLLSPLNAGFAGLALLALLALVALSLPPAWNPVRVFRRRLAVLALAASIALPSVPASAQTTVVPVPHPVGSSSSSQDNIRAVLLIAGIALVVAVVVYNASKDADSAFDDSADEIPEGAESPVSLGSFRLSERGAFADYGAQAGVQPAVSARGEASERESGAVFFRSGRESGLFGALSRASVGALAKAGASGWAVSGWSVRPSMSFTDSSKRADDARFQLRLERAF